MILVFFAKGSGVAMALLLNADLQQQLVVADSEAGGRSAAGCVRGQPS